jgi:hypothetical protein
VPSYPWRNVDPVTAKARMEEENRKSRERYAMKKKENAEALFDIIPPTHPNYKSWTYWNAMAEKEQKEKLAKQKAARLKAGHEVKSEWRPISKPQPPLAVTVKKKRARRG